MALELISRLTNVVVTAEHHHPQILSPGFLSVCEIVPETWNAVDFSGTETLSTIEYHNGVYWHLDRNSLIIEDDRPFDWRGEIEIHRLASHYLNEVRAVPYRALGLNFYLALPTDDPDGWIANRFSPPDLQAALNHGIRALPRFTLPAGQSTATIVFSGSENDLDDPSPPDDAVLLSVHVHRQGFGDVSDLVSTLSSWPTTQSTVLRAVSLLIGER